MPSTDVAALIEHRFEQTNGELALWIDDMSVRLQRRPGGWFYLAEIPLALEVNQQVLDVALRLTRPALEHFGERTAALCLNPQNASLNLLVRLKNDRTEDAVILLESLCNQCEVWQETLLSLLTRQRTAMPV
ncbi:hypothetical protein [Erwinia sp. ErVv1]|uniref:hypothetical protein n=1 Tax=Erwinia sp. ErVv1 TaxID=1603299 RepID=UPI00082B0278|nr:hypothetical protein [Erwinia sp. ErVv1]